MFRRQLAPAHLLRPRKGADNQRQDFRDDFDGRLSCLLYQSDVEIAFRVALDLCFIKRLQSGCFKKSLHGRIRRAELRSFALLFQIRLSRGNSVHGERQPARRDKRFRAFIDKTFGDELVRHHLAQIFRRLRLHARGDFFGKQFEQKFGHVTPPCPRRCASKLRRMLSQVRARAGCSFDVL